MKVSKSSSNIADFLTRLSEPFAAKDDASGNRRALVSAVLLVLSILLYWWLYL